MRIVPVWFSTLTLLVLACIACSGDNQPPIDTCNEAVWRAALPAQCTEANTSDANPIEVCTDPGFLALLQGDDRTALLSNELVQPCDSTELIVNVTVSFDPCTERCTPEAITEGECLGLRLSCGPCAPDCDCEASNTIPVTFRNLMPGQVYHLRTQQSVVASTFDLMAEGECVWTYGGLENAPTYHECEAGQLKSTQLPCE